MRKQKEWQTGRSNASGFELHWFCRTKGEIISMSKSTANYKKESINDLLEKTPLMIRIFSFLIFFAITGIASIAFSSIVMVHCGFKIAVWCLLGLGIIFSPILKNLSLDAAITYERYHHDHFSRERRQWHGAEHKLINLLTKGLPLTLENIKKMQNFYPYRKTCGSLGVSDYFSLYLSLVAFLFIFSFFSYFISFYGAIIAAFCIFFWVNFFFSYLFFYFLQKRFFTAEPTEKQMNEALEVASWLEAQILQLKKESLKKENPPSC